MIGTAKWTGVRLTEILEDAKLTSDANFIEFIGGDRAKESGFPYSISLPSKMCEDERNEIMLCYEMNDKRLTPDHGYPLRLIVPGCIGAKSVKWLTKIIVRKDEPENTFNDEFRLFLPKDIYIPD